MAQLGTLASLGFSGILRRLAPNLLRTGARNASIPRELKRANRDNKYLLTLLSQMR